MLVAQNAMHDESRWLSAEELGSVHASKLVSGELDELLRALRALVPAIQNVSSVQHSERRDG